ncbi:bifunctional endoribonuclease/protein kinase IRE1 [Sporobolomyces salmoneus]|uniref:bifunctional endoribonuclease/protein kinase IRE1 n=1 Tax=Sporobolomyces salmoneus TaxID=183962 RepID=UPI003179B8F7
MASNPSVPLVNRCNFQGSTKKRSFPLILILLLVHLLGSKGAFAQPRGVELSRRAPAPPPESLPPHLRRNSQSPSSATRSRLPDSIRQFKFNAPPSKTPEQEPEPVDQPSSSSFSLSPLVLAVTVDGQVHALKRDTGQWVWTLHDDGGVALGGIGRGSKEERKRRSRAGESIGGPLVKSVSRRRATNASTATDRSNETGLSPVTDGSGEADNSGRDDETYIIEPAGDGDIYVYSRTSGGLDKLPLSMAELVNLSPFRFPGDNSRMFSASKQTKFVGVDLKTGRLVGVFGSNAGWCEWDEVDELTGGTKGDRFEEDCEEDIAKRPEDLLYMARTEYHLSIYSSQSSSPLQTLSYTTYSSSTFPSSPSASSADFPTQATWSSTPDALYLQPMHDGSLVCFRAGRSGVHWSIDFEAPVVGVFDIAVPTSTSSSSVAGDEEIHPVMFEQPHPLLVPDLPLDFTLLQQEPAATFIGQVSPSTDLTAQGELFAMSRDRFPLVPFARLAEVAGGTGDEGLGSGLDDSQDETPPIPKRSSSDRLDLVGRHRLRNPPPPSPIHLDSTLDPAPVTSEPLLIEAGPGSPSKDSHPSIEPSPSRRSPHFPGSSTLLASMKSSVVPAWFWTKGKNNFFGKVNAKEEGNRNRRRRRKKATPQQQGAPTLLSAEATSDEREPALPPKKSFSSTALASQLEDFAATTGLRRRSPSTPPTPTSLAFTPVSPPRLRQRTRSSSLSLPFPPSIPPTVSPLKALPPLPPSAFAPDVDSAPLRPSTSAPPDLPPIPLDSLSQENSSLVVAPPAETSSSPSSTSSPLLDDSPPILSVSTIVSPPPDDDGDSDTQAAADLTSPRKKNRRRRGGKGKKKAGQAMSKEGSLDDDLPNGEKDLEELAIVEKDAVDPLMVGGLSVSETILGYGSHGTVVLRGEFQGRAVAVKRLLKDFVTIATSEVNLLQESDDHPHVIRYFCKEQRDTFLYIALELCPASLFDLIDQPSSFSELVPLLDPKKALKQIASGLRHLHNLKIVHRDIKPQNILVSTAKRGGGLRMLISDFGLCKKLDVDESSFQQTVNHAAGSFGYRAPEVLRGLVDPNETANTGAMTPSLSVGSGGSTNTLAASSNGTSTDPSMRLTRSIDIFSLGCIFYYVLTKGEHPFGGRYEREMNILQGKASVERLDGLGEEAVEVQDLILRMVASDPRERPTAEAVLLHPFFWNAQKRLLFICDASDRFEIMERDPPTPTLITLERKSSEILGDDWTKALDRTLLDNLGKYRKYDGSSLRDLLRVLRNKKHHYQDLPEPVRKNLGDLPGGFLSYFTARFPHLLLHVYDTVATHLADEAMFSSTFKISEEEI